MNQPTEDRMAEGPAGRLSEHPVRRLRFDGQEARVLPFMIPAGADAEGVAMESFAVDVDAGQILRWIMAEHKSGSSGLKTVARRATTVSDIPARSEYHLGDQEREDLSEVTTTAILEIAPAHSRQGWLLTITIEDEIGPRESALGTAAEAEHQIDLGTFYNEFIRPGRGVANVVAEVDSPAARRDVTRLLDSIERNRHPIEPKAPTR